MSYKHNTFFLPNFNETVNILAYSAGMVIKGLKEIQAKIKQETEVLAKFTSVFPFDFFPDEIIVEKNKITVIRYVFLASHEIRTMSIRDVLSVEVDTTPFFSRIKIYSRIPMIPDVEVAYMRTKDALKLQAIVQGLLIARNEQIKVEKLPTEQTTQQVRQLGKPQSSLI